MAQGHPLGRRELETVWHERLLQAENHYRQASAKLRVVQADYLEHSSPSADGNFALQHALRCENHARAEYVRVLRLFTRLILYGDPPDENLDEASACGA